MLLRTIISLVRMLSLLPSSWNRKRSSGPRDGCFKFGGTHVYHNELRVIFNFHVTPRDGNGKERQTEQVNGPRVLAMVNQKVPRVPNVFTRVRVRKLVHLVLKNPTTERSQETWETAEKYPTQQFFRWRFLA